MWGHSEKGDMYQQGEKPWRNQTCQHLDFRLPISKTEKFLLFKPVSLLWQLHQTNAMAKETLVVLTKVVWGKQVLEKEVWITCCFLMQWNSHPVEENKGRIWKVWNMKKTFPWSSFSIQKSEQQKVPHSYSSLSWGVKQIKILAGSCSQVRGSIASPT